MRPCKRCRTHPWKHAPIGESWPPRVTSSPARARTCRPSAAWSIAVSQGAKWLGLRRVDDAAVRTTGVAPGDGTGVIPRTNTTGKDPSMLWPYPRLVHVMPEKAKPPNIVNGRASDGSRSSVRRMASCVNPFRFSLARPCHFSWPTPASLEACALTPPIQGSQQRNAIAPRIRACSKRPPLGW